MGLTYSTYYDLLRLREIGPESKDWAVTDKNFQTISLVMKALEQHQHNGLPGLPLPSKAVTISIASPAVVTLASHGLTADTAIQFFTTGSLPTGLLRNTTYYVLAAGLTTNTFEVSTTPGGSPITTSGSQSGVQSIPAQPVLTEGLTGGSLAPGTVVGVRLSYVNTSGLETQATVEQDITLSSAALKPLAPMLQGVIATANALSGGTYLYVTTKVKGAGETVGSDALPVSIGFDQTYAATIDFDAISTYTDGTTQLNIYRSAGLNSTFQLIAEITDTAATSYTDNNTSVDQTTQPPSVSTFDNTRMITIDWGTFSAVPAGAVSMNIYVTQQPGIWGTNSLLTTIPLTGTPPTTFNYLGSESLAIGYPYEFTQIPDSPSAIGVSSSSVLTGTPISANAVIGAGQYAEVAPDVQITLPSPTVVINTIVGIAANMSVTPAHPVSVVGTNIIAPGYSSVLSGFTLGNPGSAVLLLSDGTNWNVISGDVNTGTNGGILFISTEETVTSGSYVTMTTPDVIPVTLRTNGIIDIQYQAMWYETTARSARAAIHLQPSGGAWSQLKIISSTYSSGEIVIPATPSAVEATTNAAVPNIWTNLVSCPAGLASSGSGSTLGGYSGTGSGDVTTGQALGAIAIGGGDFFMRYGTTLTALTNTLSTVTTGAQTAQRGASVGGICSVFADAGKYNVGVLYKAAAGGTVYAQMRRLVVRVKNPNDVGYF